MNIIYDTNAFLYLFETVNNKKYTTPTNRLNKPYLTELARDNNGYISSVVLFEILMQCIERNHLNWYSEFEDYFNFQRDFFRNYPTIINEKSHMNFDFKKFREFTDDDIRGFFDTKIESETGHLYILLCAIIHPIEQLFLDYFNKKINEEDYGAFCRKLSFETKEQLKKICTDRYNGRIDNQKFDIELNNILFIHLHKNICYLSENYPIDDPKFEYLSRKCPVLATELLNKIFSSKDGSIEYKYISDAIEILDTANIPAIDGSRAIFLKIKNNPNYLRFAKSSRTTKDDGIEYINRLLTSYEKFVGGNARKMVEKQISNIFSEAPFNFYSENTKAYLINIVKQCINKKRRLRKNDIGDFLIASMPDYFSYSNVVLNRNDQTVILSFDKIFIEFISETIYYDKDIYSNIFIK